MRRADEIRNPKGGGADNCAKTRVEKALPISSHLGKVATDIRGYISNLASYNP